MPPVPSGIPILTYHKITRRGEFGINALPPSQFYRQMHYLKAQGYTPITFQKILSDPLPAKPVIITFDDGYTSVFHHALPILEEFQFQAVIFIITGFIGKENSWDFNPAGQKFSHLQEDQLRILVEKGLELGSHGLTHRALSYLARDEIRFELTESFRQLAVIAGKPILPFAYPFGIQNSSIRDIARQAGYQFGCVNLWGYGMNNDPYCLKRIPVYRNDSIKSFQNKLSGGLRHHWEINKLRILSWPAFLTPLYQKYCKKLY